MILTHLSPSDVQLSITILLFFIPGPERDQTGTRPGPDRGQIILSLFRHLALPVRLPPSSSYPIGTTLVTIIQMFFMLTPYRLSQVPFEFSTSGYPRLFDNGSTVQEMVIMNRPACVGRCGRRPCGRPGVHEIPIHDIGTGS